MGDWRDRARCAGEPVRLFFTEDLIGGARHRIVKPTPRAQAMCDTCPVGGECLSEALLNDEQGVWGGTTYSQRKNMKKARWRVACVRCGGATIVRSHAYAVCMGCGISWRAPAPPSSGSPMPYSMHQAISTHSPQSSTPRPPLAPPHLAPLAA